MKDFHSHDSGSVLFYKITQFPKYEIINELLL
jgi:hypothetical protein